MSLEINLPDVCAAMHPTDKTPILIKRGEGGYFPFTSPVDIEAFNKALDVTPPQREAMLFGSMFGWDKPGANPSTYDPDGTRRSPGEPRKCVYAVTLEWASKISYVVVPVEASSVEEAIGLAFEKATDGYYDKQDSYDDGGETYVGHVAAHDTLEDAENAGTRDGEALSIPYEHLEDGEKLSIREKQAEVASALINDLWYFIENVTDEDPQRQDRFFALRARMRELPAGGGGAAVNAMLAALEKIAEGAPAEDPGEGDWESYEGAYNAGNEAAHYDAASIARPAIAQAKAAGIKAEE